MRVAANIVERILVSAQAEVAAVNRENDHDPAKSANLQALIEAFRRADELRRVPFNHVVLQGRKSRKPQTVITTTLTRRGDTGGEYRLCLIPNPGARRPFKYDQQLALDGGKLVIKTFVTKDVIPAFREEWISTSRLRA